MRSQILVLASVFIAMLPATQLPDGPTLVRQSLRTTETQTARSNSDIVIEMDLPNTTKTITMSSTIAWKPPSRIHLESKSEMGEMRLVSDGEFVWTWLSFLNQYTRKSVSSGALDEFRNFGFGTGDAAEAALARARTLRRERINADGTEYDCWVVEIPFKRYPLPVPPGAELRDGGMSVWIDSVTHTALRSDTNGVMHAPGMPPLKVRQSMIVRSIRMDVDIPETVFRFEPPPGAQHVTAFGPRAPQGSLTGKPVPSFSVTDMKGVRYDISNLRERVILLNFWTTWCEPCRHEVKDLDAIHRDMRGGGWLSSRCQWEKTAARSPGSLASIRFPTQWPLLMCR